MSEAFTKSFTKQFQRFAQRLGGGITASQQDINSGASPSNTPTGALSPEQVMEIMQGNSQWMLQFEQSLEQSFTKLGNRVLDNWTKNVDSELRKSIGDAISILGELAIEGGSDLFSSSSAVATSKRKGRQSTTGAALDHASSALGSLIGNVTGNLLNKALTSTKRTSVESERSRSAAEQFRNSRGQSQSDLSQEMARGKRYL